MTDSTQTIRLEDMHRRDKARPLDAAHVARLEASMRALGFIASEPITLRKDGNIYWIADGGHRHQAALNIGLAEAPAVIEDLDDAGVLTYEGALNVQRPDTQEEKWARAQGFLALGVEVDPEAVSVATGLTPETQENARKARAILADDTAFEDTTIDDLPVIIALEADKEALGEYLKTPVKQRVWKGPQILSNIRNVALIADFKATLKAAKVKLLTEMSPEGFAFISRTPLDLAKKPEGAVAVRVEDYGTPMAVWYAKDTGEQTDEQKQAAAEREARLAKDDAIRADCERRTAFIAATIDTGKNLKAAAIAAWEDGTGSHASSVTAEYATLKGYAKMLAAVAASMNLTTKTAMLSTDDWSVRQYCPTAKAMLKALQADGYELSEIEAAYLAPKKPAKKKVAE